MGLLRRSVAAVVFASGALAVVATAVPVDAGTPVRRDVDAKAIYAEHCAGCHGKEGHGDGPLALELKYKPRDFREGKFAFGNTADAMVKTILSGIPGEEQARMPAFKGVLTVAEIEAVVELVRTMMPPEILPTPAEMKLTPREGPLVARGLLAPFKAGDPPIARGLLVGLPNGFTFEYATDDLRLLAVRRGEFVTRSDWEGRGGRPLTPLGDVIGSLEQEAKLPQFRWNDKEGPSLHARLRATTVAGAACTLTCDLLDDAGEKFATVRETPSAAIVEGGAGFTRRLEIDAGKRRGRLAALFLAPSDKSATPKFDHWRSEKAQGMWLTLGADGGGFASSRFEAGDGKGECDFVVDGSMWYGAWVVLDGKPVTLCWTTVFRRDLPEGVFSAMTGELDR